MNPSYKASLPDQVLKWVLRSIDACTAIRSVERLYGGTSSLVYHISLENGQGVQSFVLRLFNNQEWLHKEPDLALHEAESLDWASWHGLPAPEMVAFDETGRECGWPAVLMTKLKGSVVLSPQQEESWLNELAEILVHIHAVNADNFPWTYFSYNDPDDWELPNWSRFPKRWGIAIDYVKSSRPESRTCFIHRDYHPANVLWTQNTITGVVDWVNACRGPAGIDIGHCRVNLAQLLGVKAADAFLTAYQTHAGSAFHYDPYWDFVSLIDFLSGPPKVFSGWKALGVSGLTDQLMAERLDDYMAHLVGQIS
ncbi:phosphotransferase family protein [Paenactinomyces guangxiensis]|uniref:Aminoglycoside phosphotransferase family protein n=1 Tax=Paenactinomyces guangxiensis TaxID=1490290 RepID=A0A7W1WPJ4_9BACL|nr:aminoglycoside phosphotransferase family protein [Paenactinomyces guangxiensis]MBA4493573.1 aminoglycoside phosphotransferase family protein [Paenactinomyces guangxiensis]MBH8590664.1 aminoglycoside phosphotransferase family protein [Paenactinomyces guangxiensis]